MSQSVADRNLLFGIVALQMDFIGREALIAAINAWTADKSRPLGAILEERGAIPPSRRSMLELLIDEHVLAHGGDPARSLAALSTVGSAVDLLGEVADTDVRASLAMAVETRAPGGDGIADAAAGDEGPAPRVRYRRIRAHARGNLGEVFVARDDELHREVALKEIRDHRADDPASRARFLVEAEITGGLEHPGIVPVYGLGRYADGRPFYAMRFIRGDSLAEAIAAFHLGPKGRSAGERSLALQGLLRRFTDVCNAVAYAHSRGVLHRDLKPGNIMVGRYGETLVVDWGLAKTLDGASSPGPAAVGDESLLQPPSGSALAGTAVGSAVGSPAYMPPEQAAGRHDELGPRSDVYGLGATLYHLLTDRVPFAGVDLSDVLARVVRGEFPAPRSIDATIPPGLEAICLKAMATAPSGRYATPLELAADVDRWLADEPVTARRDPLRTRAWRWARKHRTAATAVAAAAVVGLAALGVAYGREARIAAALGRANAEIGAKNAALTAADAESGRWLGESFRAIEDYYTDVGESVLRERPDLTDLRRRLLDRPRAFYERLTAESAAAGPGDDRALSRLARGRLDLGRISLILGRNDEARAHLAAALDLLGGLATRHPDSAEVRERIAVASHNLGKVLADTGHPAEAEAAHARAVAAFEDLVARHPDEPTYRDGLSSGYGSLGGVLSDAGRSAEAEARYRKAIATSEDLAARRPDSAGYADGLAACHINLGKLLGATGRPAEAEAALRRAVAILDGLVARSPDAIDHRVHLATGLSNLGAVLAASGRLADAQAVYARGSAESEALVARQPDVPAYREALARAYNDAGTLLQSTGRLGDAEAAYRKSSAALEALVARQPDVPEYRHLQAAGHSNLGNLLIASGRVADAEAAFARSVASREALVAGHPGVPAYREGLARELINLGVLLNATGRPGEALGAYERAVAAFEALVASGPGVPAYRHGLATGYNNLGTVYHATARPAEAERAFRRAMTASESLVAIQPDVPEYRGGLARACSNLGAVLRQLGRPGDAEAVFARSIAVGEALVAGQPDVAAHRGSLANGYNNLAAALTKLGRPAEAERAYGKAIAAFELLSARQPESPQYPSSLGVTAGNLGQLLADAGRREEAIALFRRAIALQRPVLERLPGVTEYRLFLNDHYVNLTATLRAEGRGEESAATTRERVLLWPGGRDELYNAACEFARCLPLAGGDPQRRAWAGEAMAALRAAVAAGYDDGAWMGRDPDLAPLRDRGDFREIQASLLDRAFPADPFAP